MTDIEDITDRRLIRFTNEKSPEGSYGHDKNIKSDNLDLDWGKEAHRDRIPPILRYAEWHLVILKIIDMVMFQESNKNW